MRIYLTNTLEEGVTRAEQLAGLGHYIAEEASDAAHVKKQADIMVVLGNPPYSNFGGLNKSEWILGLLDDYKRGLGERKINLDDDFIKFIRFGQWRIKKTKQGILAYITNNTYINGITHRKMRQSLIETFDEIYILDLHGSSKKGETAPDSSKDENVFDIQTGVAIGIFIKNSDKQQNPAKVRYSELWGLREGKYGILSSRNIDDLEWKDISVESPNFFFVP